MKFACFLVFSVLVAVAVSEKLTTYVRFDFRCHTAPSNDVCEITNKIPGDTSAFNGKIQAIKDTNASLSSVNDSCRSAVLKSLCKLSFSGCDADGKMVGPSQGDMDAVCQNKLPLPDDSGCDKDAVNNAVKGHLLQFCTEYKGVKEGLKSCVDHGDFLVPPCPKISYKLVNLTKVGVNVTEMEEGIKQMEAQKAILNAECYDNIMEQMCAMARQLCTVTDEGLVLSALYNEEICKEKVKCIPQIQDACSSLPPKGAKVFEYDDDDDTSGQNVVHAASLLVVTIALLVKIIL